MKKFLFLMLLILIGIQFIPVEQVNPPVQQEMEMPANVRDVIQRAVSLII